MNRGQAAAAIESLVSDAGHGIRDSYRGQAAATTESIVSNTGYGIGDGHGG